MYRFRFFFNIILIIIILSLVSLSKKITNPLFYTNTNRIITFSGSRALDNVIEQVNMGPRTPGSLPHTLFFPWLQSKIDQPGWIVELQKGFYQGHQITNIIAMNSIEPPKIIIAAHYDSRLLSDNDPDSKLRSTPVPGANDGASGVAVLIELARTLPVKALPIWLVFFDVEDNGKIPGWEWLLGSRYFVSQLEATPQAVIILDMVGDKNLNIFREINSDYDLTTEIWKVAQSLGYESSFINKSKYSILDDHIPFIDAGIPSVDIIDFDYPFWHTTADTSDKISAESLEIVGSTILNWITHQK